MKRRGYIIGCVILASVSAHAEMLSGFDGAYINDILTYDLTEKRGFKKTTPLKCAYGNEYTKVDKNYEVIFSVRPHKIENGNYEQIRKVVRTTVIHTSQTIYELEEKIYERYGKPKFLVAREDDIISMNYDKDEQTKRFLRIKKKVGTNSYEVLELLGNKKFLNEEAEYTRACKEEG